LRASDFVIPSREHAADVFDEHEPSPGLDDDAARCAPQIPLVETPSLPAGNTVRLARDTTNEAVHRSTPRLAVEGSDIAPNRSFSQSARRHV
jgi:hypothetical protein